MFNEPGTVIDTKMCVQIYKEVVKLSELGLVNEAKIYQQFHNTFLQ